MIHHPQTKADFNNYFKIQICQINCIAHNENLKNWNFSENKNITLSIQNQVFQNILNAAKQKHY